MKNSVLTIILLFLWQFVSIGQSKQNDIPVNQLPQSVRTVLNQYIQILNSNNLDDCADKFTSIAGGGLVDETGNALRDGIKPYSLKKDFENIRFYNQPPKITRINARNSSGMGYGESAIKGMVYKIWIDKKPGQAGMPAPISIMVPEGHSFINTPKVVGIGSL